MTYEEAIEAERTGTRRKNNEKDGLCSVLWELVGG